MTTKLTSQNKTIYSAYDHHHRENLVCCADEDKTKQSFRDESDINKIMARYEKTGILEHGNVQTPRFGDGSAIDFQEAKNTIIIAENMFNSLPPETRAFFHNDPHHFLNWMDDPKNVLEAQSKGLINTPTASGIVSQIPEGVGVMPPKLNEPAASKKE